MATGARNGCPATRRARAATACAGSTPRSGSQPSASRTISPAGAKNPVDEADFRVAMETATRVLGVIKGEFNTTDGYLPAEQLQRIRESGSARVIETETLRTFYFIINNSKPPLDDVNMRKALCYAFDYDGFNNNILGGTVVRNPGI